MQNSIWNSSKELDIWSKRAKSRLCFEEQQIFEYLKKMILLEDQILEIGTGAGRISYNLWKAGYMNIKATDISDSLIKTAKKIHKDTSIDFAVSNVVDQRISKGKYKAIIMLQQLLSLLPPDSVGDVLIKIVNAIPKGGIISLSFLNWNSSFKILLLSLITYFLRILTFQRLNIGNLPYFTLGDKINYKFFMKDQDTSHWFSVCEIIYLLRKINSPFRILASSHKIGKFKKDINLKTKTGFIYLIIEKL